MEIPENHYEIPFRIPENPYDMSHIPIRPGFVPPPAPPPPAPPPPEPVKSSAGVWFMGMITCKKDRQGSLLFVLRVSTRVNGFSLDLEFIIEYYSRFMGTSARSLECVRFTIPLKVGMHP